MKKIICLIMVMVTIAAMAQTSFNLNGLKYTALDENTVKVSKISDKNKPKGKLVIPPQVTYDGVTYSVTTIGSWGFFGCDEITQVELPSTLTKIDIWAFCKCVKLQEVNIPASVKEIGYAAFENCEAFTTFTLPHTINIVPERLLNECINLKEVTIPEGVTEIGSSAISRCKNLKHIKLPSTIRKIGNYAFAYNDSLKHIDMPAHLQSIGSDAFSCCISLKSIILPEGITAISDNAFDNCRSLTKVTLPASLTSLNGNPFSSCKAIAEYDVAPGSKSFAVQDGILFTADMTRLIACPTHKQVGNYTVPATVTTIAPRAFFDCVGITSIKMTGVRHIGESAFYGCHNLATVDFGKKLETLGKGAFYSCSTIESIVLPDSFKHMEMINFDFCSNLKTVSLTQDVFTREDGVNNTSFQNNSSDLKFIVRMPRGKTRIATAADLPDVKKYYRNL